MQWTDLVERVRIANTDENQKTGNASFDTDDYVYLDACDEVKNLPANQRSATLTDWAYLHDGYRPWDRKATNLWLRSAHSNDCACVIDHDGDLSLRDAFRIGICLCPVLHLKLSSFLAARRVTRDFGKIGSHTIQMGTYPQTKVSPNERDYFEQQLKLGKIRKTGKQYFGRRQNDGSFVMHDEYVIGGEKYVRVYLNQGFITCEWVKVEPVVWRVRNWDELPTSINPKGNGKAKLIDLRSEEAIISGIPFYPEHGDVRGRDTMWQNSVIRAYLNGYDLHQEIDRGNGNSKYKNKENFDFRGKGLFTEIFGGTELAQTAQKIQKPKLKKFQAPNPYDCVVNDLTNEREI
ncbi:MAG: hypothetical protein NC133_02710 [Prevotella sp.]|nr:hypothetical protein [Prevotella sp.]